MSSSRSTRSSTSAASRSTRSSTSAASASQSSNNSTEEAPQAHNDNPVVLLDDIQDDDDVILIPPVIETIDLCTSQVDIPANNLDNEIIDITDSPAQNQTARRTRRSASNAAAAAPDQEVGPIRNRRGNARTSPYARSSTKKSKPEPTTSSRPLTNLKDSTPTEALAVSCPICLDSVKNREPVSTMCGHVFCKECIQMALKVNKMCPMCKKPLKGKNLFIQIFID